MVPIVGEQLQIPSGLPKTLESALQRYGSATFKASAITVVDTTGKVSPALTYGKLLSRSKKIAYNLLNKIGQKRSSLGSSWDVPIKSGDRVALVFPNNDPMGFICAFYGCLTAGIVPVPVEVPITKRDSGSQQIGFLLGSCNINYALTSEACLKGLPKTPTGEIHTFKGWPKLNWLVSDNWPKPPKDWLPPPRISEDAVAYIEYAMDKEGSMKGVCVTRKSMISHCKALTGACSYTEGDIMVCLLDFKREVGLWHSVLTSILNGIHVIFIPYALMKVNPSCWMLMITKYKATTSICKSRDLHWGLLATKDHKDINLSSLRMLLIADGANPWSLSSCDQFLSVFNSRGLRPDAICPSASSTEAMTISIRRPGRTGIGATGRGVLSMSALSHGVIRVDQENSLTSLTLQDCGLVFICGTRDGLMQVSGRKHNTDDIIATVLAVEPMKFVYRGRIAVFSNKVLRDERICVIAEQRPDCTEEESFQWMSRVLQAIDSIHQVGIYCLALVPPNYLPKTPLGGIHLPEVKRRYLEGTLHPANVLMCPHTCVTNLPKPRETHPEIGPASVMVGNIVQGNRLAVAQGRELGPANDDPAILLGDKDDFTMSKKCQYINEILKWRAATSPNHNLFTLLNSKGSESTTLTCSQLHKRAERIACLLMEKGKINTGDHVALVYPPGIDLICAFYGCLYVGAVPVTIRPPSASTLQSTLPTMKMIVDVSKSILILSNTLTIKTIKSKEATALIELKNWVMILDTEDITKKKFTASYRAPTPEMIAYLDFSISTTGMLAGIKMSHSAATSLCKSMKLACELYPSRHIALCLDPYSGLGFILWCLSSVYSGHHSILIPPTEVELNSSLWLTTLSQYKVRDTFCSYGVMELCTKELEERPRVFLTNSFSKLFSSVGLSSRAVSTSFGCRVNVAFCLQGASSPDLTTVYVDMRALRNDRVTIVEKGAPHSLSLIESGKLLPGVRVIIANPDTKGHCGDCNLGEIWVQSPHNSSGYYTCYGDEQNNVHNNEHFNAKLTTGDTSVTYARTGYLGFLRRTQSIQADGELHDAIYVVVAELKGNENEALDLVPLITNAVLEEHQVIVGVVVVVDPGVVPIDSRGEKQRMILRDGFLADKLDPIYVAYNM
ncbi:hypothetical protein RND71_043371 [Anisodus tanguticus]|uniref:Disco-interacting protein 2 n=1 Tax=Anisodus tanguticus TaxID=243964 RepID=A0AAE1QPF8_9SOLA|nr:hypothetical protein RND71_043371 [Anisodus tanguticus]